jgi:hypothetical protein
MKKDQSTLKPKKVKEWLRECISNTYLQIYAKWLELKIKYKK